jgi:hypothetical protein
VIRLAEEGARVVVGDIDTAGARTTVESITATGGDARAVEFDLVEDGLTRSPVCTRVVRCDQAVSADGTPFAARG